MCDGNGDLFMSRLCPIPHFRFYPIPSHPIPFRVQLHLHLHLAPPSIVTPRPQSIFRPACIRGADSLISLPPFFILLLSLY